MLNKSIRYLFWGVLTLLLAVQAQAAKKPVQSVKVPIMMTNNLEQEIQTIQTKTKTKTKTDVKGLLPSSVEAEDTIRKTIELPVGQTSKLVGSYKIAGGDNKEAFRFWIVMGKDNKWTPKCRIFRGHKNLVCSAYKRRNNIVFSISNK